MNTKMFGSVRTVLSTVILVAVLLIPSASCIRDTIVSPATDYPDEGPMEVDVMEFFLDFKADLVAASAKYGDRDLRFQDIIVDDMTFLGEPSGDLYVQWGIDPERGSVRFLAHRLSDIIYLRKGYIVEIVGRAAGIQSNQISVDIIWLRVTDPPCSEPEPICVF